MTFDEWRKEEAKKDGLFYSNKKHTRSRIAFEAGYKLGKAEAYPKFRVKVILPEMISTNPTVPKEAQFFAEWGEPK